MTWLGSTVPAVQAEPVETAKSARSNKVKRGPFSLSGKIALITPIIGLAVVSLMIGLNANSFIKLSEKAAYEMKHPEIYINNVLGITKE